MTNYFEIKTWQDRFRLACFVCGKTEEYSNSEFAGIKNEVKSRTGFDIRVATLELRGKCRFCQQAQMSVPQVAQKRPVN